MNSKLFFILWIPFLFNLNCSSNEKGIEELFNNGEYDKVIERCNEALLKNNSIEALHYRGESYLQLGKDKKAFKDFTTLYMMGDTSVETIKGLAFSSLALREYAYSRNVFEKLVQRDTSDYNYFCLSIVSFNDNKVSDALKYMDVALKTRPFSAKYLFNKGLLLQKIERFRESITCFTKIIENGNNNDSFYFTRGVSFGQIEKYDSSILDFTKAIELNRTGGDYLGGYYYNRAYIYMFMGEKKKATLDFEKAKSLGYNDMDEELVNYCR